jgi:hypothetical protein
MAAAFVPQTSQLASRLNASPRVQAQTRLGNMMQRRASAPVQRLTIPAVHEGDLDIDTERVDFEAHLRDLVRVGNVRRLMHIVKFLASRPGSPEVAGLVAIVHRVVAAALPAQQVEDIHGRVEALKQVLHPAQLNLLVELLQRDTITRTGQLMALRNPADAGRLIEQWSSEEEAVKQEPVSRGWENPEGTVRPLINLINSVLEHGILSRNAAAARGLTTVGSEDRGGSNNIALNALANPTGTQSGAEDAALDSLSAEHRGAISVALEREDDPIKREERVADQPLTEEQQRQIDRDPSDAAAFTSLFRKLNYRAALGRRVQGRVANERAQATIMTILGRRSLGAERHERETTVDQSWEDEVAGSRQAPARILPGHIQVILVPDFVRPYFDRIVNPADIPIRFVSNMRVSAHYKTPEGDQQIDNIMAPSYVQGIAAHLRQAERIFTHIVTTNPEAPAAPTLAGNANSVASSSSTLEAELERRFAALNDASAPVVSAHAGGSSSSVPSSNATSDEDLERRIAALTNQSSGSTQENTGGDTDEDMDALLQELESTSIPTHSHSSGGTTDSGKDDSSKL